MSQAESTSDSDSNTSSSWIFVDECISDSESEKNKYYLNCSTEPVQELTPQCLDSVNSEQETDSDGISIISESEDLKEQPVDEVSDNYTEERNDFVETKDAPAETKDISIETLTSHDQPINVKEDFYFNKLVIVGWVLIALITPILLNYFTTYRNDNFVHEFVSVPKKDTNNYKSPETVTSTNVLGSDESKQVTDGTKRKYESKGEIDIHRFDCKEGGYPYEEYKTSKHKKKDKKRQLNQNDDDVEARQAFKKKTSAKIDLNPKESNDNKRKHKKGSKQILQEKKINYAKNSEHKKLVKEKYLKHKNKELKNQKEESDNAHIKNSLKKKIKKFKKSLRQRDKEIKELTKLLKIKDKQLKFLEYKVLKELNILRQYDTFKHSKTTDDFKRQESKINGTSSDWYYRMHEGRDWLRNQRHISEWIFNTADLRKQKRSLKNNWYWNWMSNREHLRLKRGVW